MASMSRIWLYCLKDGTFLICFVSKILDFPESCPDGKQKPARS